MSDSDDVNSWRVGVDIGGTFTDVVLWNGRDDAFFVDKLLTSTDDPSRSVVNGIRNVIHAAGIRGQDVASVIHGTTLVANALIERKGVKTALLTTRGLRTTFWKATALRAWSSQSMGKRRCALPT